MGSCNSGGKGGGGSSAFGKQGKAKTPNEALANTNPNFNKGREYQINCQRCVYAYELQRQGYDVEAKPRVMNGKDPMDNGTWKNGFENQTWEGSLGTRNTSVEKNIVSKMQGWGDGSRGIVYVAWKGGNAHVFNIENKGGKVSIFDGQVGKSYSLSDYLSLAKPSSTMLSRVDNLKPNNNVLQYAVKKKGK
jgi:hypothetical protein